MRRTEVYRLIDGERAYQDALYYVDGRTDGRQKSVGDYLTLIRAYSALADAEYTGNPGDKSALQVIRKIAGICVQAMEVHGAPPRPSGEQTGAAPGIPAAFFAPVKRPVRDESSPLKKPFTKKAKAKKR
jgi:hypothetical protein